ARAAGSRPGSGSPRGRRPGPRWRECPRRGRRPSSRGPKLTACAARGGGIPRPGRFAPLRPSTLSRFTARSPIFRIVRAVRAAKAADVAALTKRIQDAFPGATVTSAKDLAANISGSLVDAGNLARRLGGVLAVVVMISAFLVAALLTLSSVNKRVRELGTLKAIGWRQGLVVRQVVGETAVQGLLGGVLGAGLGVGAAALAAPLAPTLNATHAAAAGPGSGFLGLRH